MRDLAFLGFLMALIGAGFRRPFIFVLVYVYVDIVSPQRLTYFLLNSVPVSLITVVLAFLGWALVDDKRGTSFTTRQALMAVLLIYCGVTTTVADFPLPASDKWSWVWKSLVFAIFLPLTLRTKLRLEATALFMILSAATIIIVGGIKTLASGGGYGVLNLMVDNNAGLYESSTIAMASICIVPLILHFRTHSSIFPPEWRVNLFCYALVFACLLIPVGTEARTGLVCIGVLAVLMLRSTKRRFLYLALMAALPLAAYPMLPESFQKRMSTIQDYKSDQSASTRVAVWKWTLDYVEKHPMGGGFEAYRGNTLRFDRVTKDEAGNQTDVQAQTLEDKGRAYHSSYFEMLGEQGYIGLSLWLMIQLIGLVRMEVLRRRFKKGEDETRRWIGSFAEALQHGQVIYLVGALFVGVAFQPFFFMLLGLQIGLDTYSARAHLTKRKPEGKAFIIHAQQQ